MSDIALPYFLARPAADPPWPGVLVIHEGNGISAQLLRVCQRLAAEGYAAIAPDLFFRSGGTEAADFGTLIGALDREQVKADTASAIAQLRSAGATKVGVTGFCLGGSLSYRAACQGLPVDAAAPFYGSFVAAERSTPACPVLIFFGGRDDYIPQADIDVVSEHHPGRVVVYPDAGHGFMRDGSDSYNGPAAKDAWERLLRFFEDTLR